MSSDPRDALTAADFYIRVGALNMAERALLDLHPQDTLTPALRKRVLDGLARIAERRGDQEKAARLLAEAEQLVDDSDLKA